MNFKILCATSGVANAGIDCKDVRVVFRIDIPPSIRDLAQEMGRAGRCDLASDDYFSYYVFFCLNDYVLLFRRIMSEKCIDASYRYEQLPKYLLNRIFARSN